MISTINQCGHFSDGNFSIVACAFIYGTDVPFYFWDMFILGSNIEHYALQFEFFLRYSNFPSDNICLLWSLSHSMCWLIAWEMSLKSILSHILSFLPILK